MAQLNVSWDYIENVVGDFGDGVVTISGDYSIEESDRINTLYVVSDTLVTITLNDTTENRVINIKKISGNNDVIVNGNVDGVVNKRITKNNTCISIKYNQNIWRLI
jgi:hypothetical protein